MTTDYEKLFAGFFHEAANAAGVVALNYFRQVIPIDDKEDKLPVTQADREIEKAIRALINYSETILRHHPSLPASMDEGDPS